MWDFKEQAIYYLTKDLVSLCQVATAANHALYLKFKVNITDAITSSGLANRIFRQNHYKNKVIPLINNKNIIKKLITLTTVIELKFIYLMLKIYFIMV